MTFLWLFHRLHRPDGADELLLAALPTLKRGANDRCASGAIQIGTSLVNKRASCDCPEMRRPELDESGPSLFQHRPNSAGDCRLDYLSTVKVRVVDSDVLPLLPVMVMT